MEQQPHPTVTVVQSADCPVVVVVVEIHQALRVNDDAQTSHGNVNDVHGSREPAGINVLNRDTTTSTLQETTAIDVGSEDDGTGSENLCVVCKEPLVWVAIGRCGHRVVCRRCTVRLRFFHRDKRCRVCRTRCPTVVVAKTSASADILSTLPLFSLREGRVGRFWSGKVRAYALSISCAALVAMIVWSAVQRFTQDPLEIEDSRRPENQ
ncbi:hypothetical protein HU200_052009 [Digitaria exilis]|uniref:RING-type domain-containing protein n=1 Tax=Digitaria exilis TaxID=1010633 RepID=A0A835E7P8_9POAL|nr:hypothetical protein HU200_052009 [Digitaria exilis]